MVEIKNKNKYISLFIGILLTVFGVILVNSLVERISDLNGKYGFNKIQFNLKNSKVRHINDIFRIEHIEQLTNELKSDEFNCIAECKGKIVSDSANTFNIVNIVGTNDKFNDFNLLNFKRGFFFNKNNYVNKDKVIVLDQDVAWDLYGSLDVIGNQVNLLGSTFRIIGVTNKDKSNVYIPLNLFLNSNNDLEITNITIKITNETSDNFVLETIQKLGIDRNKYNITNYDKLEKVIKSYSKSIIFLIGIITIVIIFKLIVYESKKKFHLKKLSYKLVIEIISALGVIAFIINTIYIDIDYINYNIFDYIKTLNSNIIGQHEIILLILSEVVVIIFTMLVGGINLYYAFRLNRNYIFSKVSLLFILSIIISSSFVIILGFNINLNLQQLLIIYINLMVLYLDSL